MKLIYLLAPLCLVGCQPTGTAYDFRDEARPDYTRVVTPDQMAADEAPEYQVIDVRLQEDFETSPDMIPGATRLDPEEIANWSETLDAETPVVVYCVKGGWVSQKAATYLADQGYDVLSLEGGIQAWEASAGE